jgi:hypothetical protein
MRRVALKLHVSLDGYVRAADGDVMGWVFRSYDDELNQWATIPTFLRKCAAE